MLFCVAKFLGHDGTGGLTTLRLQDVVVEPVFEFESVTVRAYDRVPVAEAVPEITPPAERASPLNGNDELVKEVYGERPPDAEADTEAVRPKLTANAAGQMATGKPPTEIEHVVLDVAEAESCTAAV